jgi:hypothetical protein
VVGSFLRYFEVIEALGIDCKNAFGIGSGIYEDAMLVVSVARAGLDCNVERNPVRSFRALINKFNMKHILSM